MMDDVFFATGSLEEMEIPSGSKWKDELAILQSQLAPFGNGTVSEISQVFV